MSNVKINITFEYFDIRNYYARSVIRKSIISTLKAQGVSVPCEINVLVTDDSGIQQINKASRNIDSATDVLSFPMFALEAGVLPENWDEYQDPETGLCPLGDIALSLERATAQAKEFGHSTKREIGYLIIHSVLHLLGYDHLDEGAQKAQMREREETIANSTPGMQR